MTTPDIQRLTWSGTLHRVGQELPPRYPGMPAYRRALCQRTVLVTDANQELITQRRRCARCFPPSAPVVSSFPVRPVEETTT